MSEILPVEDDATVRAALVRSLADRGHRVIAVSTAMDGLRAVAESGQEVVVPDLDVTAPSG